VITGLSAGAVAAAAGGGGSIWAAMFTWEVPPAEKVLRTVIVYLFIAFLIRVAGKRQMAQLNSFDLVVVLLLSNVVQNAIIGPDNSVIGGLLGAATLVGFNSVMDRVGLLNDKTRWLFEGNPTVLVSQGKVDERAMRRVGLRDHEFASALRKQGADNLEEVRRAALEPGGSITVDLKREDQAASLGELRQAVTDLQRHLDERLSAIEAAAARSRPSGSAG